MTPHPECFPTVDYDIKKARDGVAHGSPSTEVSSWITKTWQTQQVPPPKKQSSQCLSAKPGENEYIDIAMELTNRHEIYRQSDPAQCRCLFSARFRVCSCRCRSRDEIRYVYQFLPSFSLYCVGVDDTFGIMFGCPQLKLSRVNDANLIDEVSWRTCI